MELGGAFRPGGGFGETGGGDRRERAPVSALLDEAERVMAAIDRLVEEKYPEGSPQYEEWWRIRQVKGDRRTFRRG